MIDGLAAVFASIDHHAVAPMQIAGARDLSRDPQQVAEQGAMGRFTSASEAMCSRGAHEHVNRSLRTDVGESVTELVLVDGRGRDASFNDLAEEATHNANSVQERFSRKSFLRRRQVRVQAKFIGHCSIRVDPTGIFEPFR